MSADFVSDLDIVDPTTVETTGPSYPVAQWLNGDPKLAAAGGVAHTGGVILPTKYVDENLAPAPGWTRATIAFESGKSDTVLAAQKPRLAVVRTRFRWFVVYNGVTTFYPRSGYVAESGMRGHVQALCGVHGFDFPVVITFKGRASQEFERLLKEFSQKVGEAAAHQIMSGGPKSPAGQPTPLRFPRFAFYLRLAPSPHVKAGRRGQESIVTPPQMELPNVINDDYLSKIYVGRDRLVALQDVYRQAAEWVAAWDRPGAEGEPPDDVESESELEDSGNVGNSGNGVVDVLTAEQALALLHHHQIDPGLMRQALREANGRETYSPSRDTALVRKLVNQHGGPKPEPAGPAAKDEKWPPDDF